jgi:hypothetical protein
MAHFNPECVLVLARFFVPFNDDLVYTWIGGNFGEQGTGTLKKTGLNSFMRQSVKCDSLPNLQVWEPFFTGQIQTR